MTQGPPNPMRYLAPLLIGALGCAILAALGVWQIQRLAWKEAILAEIEARIGEAPRAIPADPSPARDRYRPVRIAGRFTGHELHVLSSVPREGPAVRVIAEFVTADGPILVDRGLLPFDARDAARPPAEATLTGNLHWPRETDRFTPAPEDGLWFARDVAAMADALGTRPVLVVAASDTGQGVRPAPVTPQSIPTNPPQYAITWFSRAAAWGAMTALWLRRRAAAA